MLHDAADIKRVIEDFDGVANFDVLTGSCEVVNDDVVRLGEGSALDEDEWTEGVEGDEVDAIDVFRAATQSELDVGGRDDLDMRKTAQDIGDTDIGERSNIGAGTITANYDGYRKHRTKIGSGVKVSVDTTFIAPVTVGDDAYTGAGSVITEDVPAGALGVARPRQRNVEGYAQRRVERAAADESAEK